MTYRFVARRAEAVGREPGGRESDARTVAQATPRAANTTANDVGHTPPVAEDESPKAEESEPEGSPGPPEQQESFSELRHYVPADLLNVSFPMSVRGYDRHAVEAHLKRVNRVIAELKVRASPRAAVTHALEQTEQQVSGLLQRARETGEEITASARQEGEEITAVAKAEAAELLVNVSAEADGIKAEAEKLIADARTEAEDTLVRSRLEAENTLARARAQADEQRQQLQRELAALREEAETRMRELQADTEAVWKERRQLLEDIRGRASGLLDLADAAAVRKPAESEDELEPEPVDEIERAGVEPTETTPDDAATRSRRKRGRTAS
jgi:DivIVA domain-containing protein